MPTVNIKMNPEDEAALTAAGNAYNEAMVAGDEAARKKAHADAERIRANYGYSGGEDGSQFVPLGSGGTGSGYDLSAHLKDTYAAQVEAQLAGLKGAYEQSMAGYDARLERLPQTYDAARNKVAAQDAIARKSFDERAAASGLNSGTSGQVELARSSAYRRDLANLDQEQANAVSDLELEKANLIAQYKSAMAQARADGDADLAKALYQELVRVQGLEREDEQIQAAREAEEKELALRYGLFTDGTASPAAPAGPVKNPGAPVDDKDKPQPTPAPTPVGEEYDPGKQAEYLAAIDKVVLEDINRAAENGMDAAAVAARIQNKIDQGKITKAQGEALAVSFGW